MTLQGGNGYLLEKKKEMLKWALFWGPFKMYIRTKFSGKFWSLGCLFAGIVVGRDRFFSIRFGRFGACGLRFPENFGRWVVVVFCLKICGKFWNELRLVGGR